MARRVLVIALDGTTFDLIGPWLDDGTMPNLARLRTEGVSGPLRSVVPPVTEPAWCSFMTGKNPGRHGVFDARMRSPGGHDEDPVSSRSRSGRTLWELLGDGGRRVLVVNVPVTHPPGPVNGDLIGNAPTPTGSRDFTWPSGLLDELEAATGPYPADPVETYRPGGAGAVLDELERVLEARHRANLWLIANRPWDFAMFHVCDTDRFGHELWHLLDERHPMHDPAERHIHGERARAYWRRVDEVVGDWIAAAGDGVTTVVLSGHGFGPVHRFLGFNVWLLQQGWIRLKPELGTFLRRSLLELGSSPALASRVALRLGFARLRPAVSGGTRRRWPVRMNRAFLSLGDVDWSRTRAYSEGSYGQLFLNLKGREPFGVVEPGAEAEAVLDDLMGALRDLREPGTDRPLIGDIWRAGELYRGPCAGRAPDLTFLPRDPRDKAFGTADFASHRFIEPAWGNSGDHRMNGILLMRGPGIREDAHLEGTNLIDVTPTLLHYLGDVVPADIDGRVLQAAFTPEESARPVQSRAEARPAPPPGT